MRIIVSDTSCLIDLHKVELLLTLLDLPYTFVIPHTLFDDELSGLSDAERNALVDAGLEVRELDGDGVRASQRHFNDNPGLHLNDCFAMRMAEEIADAILMTGDATLREVAARLDIEVHGVLWVADEFDAHRIVDRPTLQAAVRAFRDDPLVFLPLEELALRIRRFGRQRGV